MPEKAGRLVLFPAIKLQKSIKLSNALNRVRGLFYPTKQHNVAQVVDILVVNNPKPKNLIVKSQLCESA